jgi:hypothetical protein
MILTISFRFGDFNISFRFDAFIPCFIINWILEAYCNVMSVELPIKKRKMKEQNPLAPITLQKIGISIVLRVSYFTGTTHYSVWYT